MLNPGIVNQDVELTEFLDDAVHHSRNRLGLAHVSPVVDGLHPVGFQTRPLFIDGSGIAEAVDDDIDAGLGEALGNP